MTTIWFDEELGEHVGLDTLQREHFGQSFAACLERVSEANRVIADDMRKQPENYDECTCADEHPDREANACPSCARAIAALEWEEQHGHQYARTDGRTYSRPRP